MTKAYLNALCEEGSRDDLFAMLVKLDAENDALRAAAAAAPPPAEARDVAREIIREWDALPADDNRDWTEQLAPIIAAALAKYAAARVAEERARAANIADAEASIEGIAQRIAAIREGTP